MDFDDVCFYHLRIGHGVTLAYYIQKETGHVFYSYAICSKKDQYCKAFGRELAEDRLLHNKQKKVSAFDAGPEPKRFDVLRLLVIYFLGDVRNGSLHIKAPSWLKKIVKVKEKDLTESIEKDSIRSIAYTLFPERKIEGKESEKIPSEKMAVYSF